MIELHTDLASSFGDFSKPPTHFYFTSIEAAYIPNGIKMLHLNGHYGIVDSHGNFILNPYLPVMDIRIPDANRVADVQSELKLLEDFFKDGQNWTQIQVDELVISIVKELKGKAI
jgi:hypothetical protein